MRLSHIHEDKTKIVTKVVLPGDWPARNGMTIPGDVLPWATVDSHVWSQAKYTRDVLDDSVQGMHYLVYLPAGKSVPGLEQRSMDPTIDFPCRYKLVNVVNRPWDPNEREQLPKNLAIVERERLELNWVISLEHDLEKQIRTLISWTMDDISDLNVGSDSVKYYSSQQSKIVKYPIRPFPNSL